MTVHTNCVSSHEQGVLAYEKRFLSTCFMFLGVCVCVPVPVLVPVSVRAYMYMYVCDLLPLQEMVMQLQQKVKLDSHIIFAPYSILYCCKSCNNNNFVCCCL